MRRCVREAEREFLMALRERAAKRAETSGVGASGDGDAATRTGAEARTKTKTAETPTMTSSSRRRASVTITTSDSNRALLDLDREVDAMTRAAERLRAALSPLRNRPSEVVRSLQTSSKPR